MIHQVLDSGVYRDATPEEAVEIEARIAAGLTILPPHDVTRRQGLQQLRLEGFTEADIEALIALLPISALQKDLALIEFRTSQVFERYRPLTITLGGMIGKNSAGLDSMFIAADAL